MDYDRTINSVTGTVQETQALIVSVERLLNSPGWKEPIPELQTALGQISKAGEELIDYSYQQAFMIVLIAVTLVFLLAFFLVWYSLRRIAAIRQDSKMS
jgi:hypothetical protein